MDYRIPLPGLLLIMIFGIQTACNQDGQQAGRAAEQDPRYEVVKNMVRDSQQYFFTEFNGNKELSHDSLRYFLRPKGNGQYVAYELYNLYTNTTGALEADVLETDIDVNDTLLKQKVRDQRFLLQGDSVSLTRFDTKHVALQETYEIPAGDSVYQVYNFFGYAHQSDYTPSHRIFWTQEFGSFLMWYGDWKTIELTNTTAPLDSKALYDLRAAVRELLAIPFAPPTDAEPAGESD